jgi:hypothetical protein
MLAALLFNNQYIRGFDTFCVCYNLRHGTLNISLALAWYKGTWGAIVPFKSNILHHHLHMLIKILIAILDENSLFSSFMWSLKNADCAYRSIFTLCTPVPCSALQCSLGL